LAYSEVMEFKIPLEFLNNPSSITIGGGVLVVVDDQQERAKWFPDIYSVSAVYTLKTGVNGNGSVDPPSGAHVYYDGESVAISASAASGWIFSHWSGDVTTVADVKSASTTIKVDREYSIFANFEKLETPTTTSTSVTTTSPTQTSLSTTTTKPLESTVTTTIPSTTQSSIVSITPTTTLTQSTISTTPAVTSSQSTTTSIPTVTTSSTTTYAPTQQSTETTTVVTTVETSMTNSAQTQREGTFNWWLVIIPITGVLVIGLLTLLFVRARKKG
jgi:hypothetical protein